MQRCPQCNEFIADGEVQCRGCSLYLDGVERVNERCECGNLVAKLTESSVEVKCRRCKRIRTIALETLALRYGSRKNPGSGE